MSFIALTSMLGIMLGVAVMIVVLSVMNGFEREMRDRVLQLIPHITIESDYPITNWQEVAHNIRQHAQVLDVSSFIYSPGLFSVHNHISKVMLEGVDDNFNQVSIVSQFIEQGSFANLTGGSFNVILGRKLATELGVKVGDKITFVVPEIIPTPAGIFPRLKRFTVAGIFHVGIGEIDGFVAYANIGDLAKLKRWSATRIQGLRVKTADLFQAHNLAQQIVNNLGEGYFARNWTSTHGDLYQTIGVEKNMVGLLLLLIIAVAVFNLVSCLMMVVNAKKGAIAILRTLGLSPFAITQIFMVQGLLIGVIGTLLGVALGLLIAGNISSVVAFIEQFFSFKFLDAGVYFIDYLPSHIKISDVAKVSLATVILSLIATIYPAFKAAKTEPAKALRYE